MTRIQRDALIGALAAIVIIWLIHFTPEFGGQVVFGALLGWAGGIGAGTVFTRSEPRWVAAELAVSAGLLCLAWIGLFGNPKWLAAGYLIHGVWAVLQPRLAQTEAPDWLAPLSAAFDAVVVVWILWKV